LTRQDYEAEITKRAEATRSAGETIEKALTRIATTTEEGKLLFKASVMAPPRQADQDLAPRKSPEPVGGPATAQLNAMARAMARDKGVSFESAFARLWSDPERAELIQRAKREIAEATREVKSQRWPIEAAERELEQNWRLGRSPGSARM
jgi:hypothetical protein